MPLEYTRTVASTMLATTAGDMARFLMMHLRNGRIGVTALMGEAGVDAMHTQQFTNHPAVPGMAFGFYEMAVNGKRILTHGGGNDGAHGMIYLLPADDLAVFMAFNTDSGAYQVRAKFQDAFFARYFPAGDTPQPTYGEFAAIPPIGAFAGRYQSMRSMFRSNAERIDGTLGDAQFEIEVVSDQSIRAGGGPLVRIGPLLFRDPESGTLLGFKLDRNNEVRWASSGLVQTFERLRWYDSSALHVVAISTSVFILLLNLGVTLIVAFRRLVLKKQLSNSLAVRRVARMISLLCLIEIVFLIGVSFFGPSRYEIPSEFVAASYLPLIVALLIPFVVVFAALLWRRDEWSAWRRGYHVLVLAGLCGFTTEVYYFNLLGIT